MIPRIAYLASFFLPLVAACGGNASSTSTTTKPYAGCPEGESVYVEVNNHTGAEAAIYAAGGQYIGSARPGRTEWRLPANTSYAYVGGATREPYQKDNKRNPRDKPDVGFAYRCE
jgi:hypothetical protein